MLSLRLPKELEQRLENVSKTTCRSKTYYVKKALEQFLEDQEDYLAAVAALENDKGKRISLDEIKKLANL
ncbi:MAG: anti-toxin [Alphaproteobacteria bacterium]|jgi:RHH-type rel operon transcriptional repressor/antitoxin RelB|nr:anti-toxin [Alphaproteobacteria bacterium]